MVMLDIKTGEVLAMVNTPSYNPNNRGQYQSFRVRNRVVTDTYEPGSTVKPLILLSALQAGVTSWKDFIPGGPLFIGAKQIKDVSIHKATNLYDILRYSSNIGMSRIALRMPAQEMINTLSMFGFGMDTGSGLMGESSGMLPQRRRWSRYRASNPLVRFMVCESPRCSWLPPTPPWPTRANGCRSPSSR